MRRRSITGPLLLLLVGGFFLWRNLYPQAPVFDIVAQYWPFVLIAWGLLRLVEVVLTRDVGRAAFSGGETALVILMCFVGWGIWAGYQHGVHLQPQWEWFGEQYDYPVTASAPAAGMQRVTFEVDHGNIKVIGGDVQEVTITGHKTVRAYNHGDADRINGETPLEIVPQGDRLLVRANQDRAQGDQRVSDDIEVTIPRGLAVESRATSGDYDISDVNGDIDLATNRGDVRLARIGGNARLEIGRSDLIRATDVKGHLELQGRGSDVELENIAGQVTIGGAYTGTLDFKNLAKPLDFQGARNTELAAAAIPGHVTMDLGELSGSGITGPVRLVSGNRDIKLEQFTQSLEMDTQRGDIELDPGAPLPSIEVRAGGGRIALVLPDKAGFRLDATAEHGEVVNDFGAGVQSDVEGHTSTLKGAVGDGPQVRLSMNRGQIEVRKGGNEGSNADGLKSSEVKM